MLTDAEEQADEAASLEAIFGEDIEFDASAYRVRQATLQQQVLQHNSSSNTNVTSRAALLHSPGKQQL